MARNTLKNLVNNRLPPLFGGHILLLQAKSDPQLEKILSEENHRLTHCDNLDAAFDLIEENKNTLQTAFLHVANPTAKTCQRELEWLQRCQFEFPNLPLVVHLQTLDKDFVESIFELHINAIVTHPSHSLPLKQAVRKALETHAILKSDIELERSHLLHASLKAITHCQDHQTLNRLLPHIFVRHFGDVKIALFRLQHAEKQSHFVPLNSWKIERKRQAYLADFLTWFYRRRWRRFNQPVTLRGTYKPWSLKTKLGRCNLLVPIRHKEGLWGAALLTRAHKPYSFTRPQRILAEVLGTHIARTHYILQHYLDSDERTFKDTITNLYNRRYFEFYGEHEFQSAKREGTALTILAVNVSKFRQVNDQHGHLAGGKLLAHIASDLKQALRESDIVVRLDGGLFVAILRKTDKASSVQVTERVERMITTKGVHLENGVTLLPEIHIVTASFPHEGSTLHALVEKTIGELGKPKNYHVEHHS